jgi:hypothetical protein
VLDGDLIELVIDRERLEGRVNLIGAAGDATDQCSIERGDAVLAERALRPDLTPHPELPDDTRLWAVLQQQSGGIWGGCVCDAEVIAQALTGTSAARAALHPCEATR